MDKNVPQDVKHIYCNICNRTITNPQDIQEHINGTKHKQLKRKTTQESFTDECGIVVSAIPTKTKANELKSFFNSHGEVKYLTFNENVATVQFKDTKSVDNLLSKRIYFKGKLLEIKKKTKSNTKQSFPRPPKPPALSQPELDFNAITNAIKQQNNFDDQLKAMLEELQLPSEEMSKKYGALCSHLEMVLSKSFTDCSVLPFGSTVTGLGFKDSDVDIYVFVPYPEPPDNSSKFTTANLVKKSKNLLYKYQNLFTNIIAIPHAKTPIVKCLHKPTKINCDFNFKNLLGVCNSNLIRFLLSIDARLKPLTMIIKYWAKIRDLTGPGKLSNYALVTLIIFFLQQPPDPILPPIETLQTNEAYSNVQEGWNGGFNNDLSDLPPVTNNKTVIELLTDFFKFYSTFAIPVKVICPLTGTAFNRSDFFDLESLPTSLELYKSAVKNGVDPLRLDAPMCVQDCFELCHNLTASATPVAINTFYRCCLEAAKICDEVLISKKYETLLLRIFNETMKSYVDPKNNKIILGEFCTIEINAGCFIYSQKNNDIENSVDKEQSFETVWYSKVNKTLILVLTQVFKFEVKVEKHLHETSSDTSRDDYIESLLLQCSTIHNLWTGRKKIKLPNTGNCIDLEIKRSEMKMESFKNNPAKQNVNILEFIMFFHAKKNPTRVTLELKCDNSKYFSNFTSFVYFLRLKLPAWIEKS